MRKGDLAGWQARGQAHAELAVQQRIGPQLAMRPCTEVTDKQERET